MWRANGELGRDHRDALRGERGEVSELHRGHLRSSWGEGLIRNIHEVIFYQFSVRTAVHIYLLGTSAGEEFERVFDEWGVCERKKTLRGAGLALSDCATQRISLRQNASKFRLDWENQRTLGLTMDSGANLVSKASASTTAGRGISHPSSLVTSEDLPTAAGPPDLLCFGGMNVLVAGDDFLGR